MSRHSETKAISPLIGLLRCPEAYFGELPPHDCENRPAPGEPGGWIQLEPLDSAAVEVRQDLQEIVDIDVTVVIHVTTT